MKQINISNINKMTTYTRKFTAVFSLALSLALAASPVFMTDISASEINTATTQSTTASSENATQNNLSNDTVDYKTGDANDIKIEGVSTQPAAFNGVAGIAFTAVLDDRCIAAGGAIKSIRPKADTSSPFVMDNAMYAIATPSDDKPEEKLSLYAGFVFNVKGDVKTAYYPIAFEIEYVKNGTIYRVEKSIDIALYGNETETTSTTSDSATSVPRIIVTGYETNPEKVMAGEEFELTIHLKNTSNITPVSNIKVTLSTSGNEFLPTSGSSTTFVRNIACGAQTDIVMQMTAQASLEQKPYVLSVKCEYEGEKNASYSADESISIPVYQEAKAKITDLEVSPSSFATYDQADVMFSINNTGKSTLYNVQVSVDPDNKYVTSDDSFVGNINAGSTGYADFLVTGIAPTEDDGNVTIIIYYEDADGNPGTFTTQAQMYVYEMNYDDYYYDDYYDYSYYEEETGSFPWLVVIIGAVVVIAVIIVTVVIIKKKKQKALEEELEDEIS